MTSAQVLRPTPSNLGQVLAAAQWVRHQLLTVYGVTLASSDRVDGPLAHWSPTGRTLTFRHDTSATDMAWTLGQLWTMLSVGPSATVGYRRATPTLRLIPSPRDGQ